MFNIPVISNNARLTPPSSGAMHLNALNGSSYMCSDDSSSASSLPSYEEALSNAPLFGLFNVNGGDIIHHHQHHHNYHHHNNSHIHFPQSHHTPNISAGGYPPPTYQELLSAATESGSDASSHSCHEPPRTGRPESRLQSRDSNVAERDDPDELCERLPRLSIVSNPALLYLHSSPVSLFLLSFFFYFANANYHESLKVPVHRQFWPYGWWGPFELHAVQPVRLKHACCHTKVTG